MSRALETIESIKLPSNDEIDKMTLEQVIEWREKLRHHYERQKEYQAIDYKFYRIARHFEVFDKIAFNMQNKLPMWQGISNGYN